MVWDSVWKNLPTSPSTADGRREGIPGEEFLANRVPWKEEWSYSREMLVSSRKMWNCGCGEWPGLNPQRNVWLGRGHDKWEWSEGSSLLEKGTGIWPVTEIHLSCSLGCWQKSNSCSSHHNRKGKIWQIPQKTLFPPNQWICPLSQSLFLAYFFSSWRRVISFSLTPPLSPELDL